MAAGKLKAHVAQTLAPHVPASASPPAPPPPAVGGRRIVLERISQGRNMEALVRRYLGKSERETLGLDEKEFLLALKETEHRLARQRATVDQLVGTFLEVVGPEHPLALEIRAELVGLNLDAALFAAFTDEAVFISAGTQGRPKSFSDLDIELPWRSGESAPAVSQGRKRGAGPAADAWVGKGRDNIDMSRVVPVRDLEIDGVEYADRAVLLDLGEGQWLLLLTEEYKTPGSGGVNAQTAIRDNRLFNENVTGKSMLTVRDANGNPLAIPLGKLLVNAATTASDKLAIKAASRTRYEQRTPRVTKAIKERRDKYGDVRELGEHADVSLFFLGLAYPARCIRDFMEHLWRQAAP